VHECRSYDRTPFSSSLWLPAADGFVVETVLRASTQRKMMSHIASDDSEGFEIGKLLVQLPIDDPLV
jgi:hypothetical protein